MYSVFDMTLSIFTKVNKMNGFNVVKFLYLFEKAASSMLVRQWANRWHKTSAAAAVFVTRHFCD